MAKLKTDVKCKLLSVSEKLNIMWMAVQMSLTTKSLKN
jgi:hypothetical protein